VLASIVITVLFCFTDFILTGKSLGISLALPEVKSQLIRSLTWNWLFTVKVIVISFPTWLYVPVWLKELILLSLTRVFAYLDASTKENKSIFCAFPLNETFSDGVRIWSPKPYLFEVKISYKIKTGQAQNCAACIVPLNIYPVG